MSFVEAAQLYHSLLLIIARANSGYQELQQTKRGSEMEIKLNGNAGELSAFTGELLKYVGAFAFTTQELAQAQATRPESNDEDDDIDYGFIDFLRKIGIDIDITSQGEAED